MMKHNRYFRQLLEHIVILSVCLLAWNTPVWSVDYFLITDLGTSAEMIGRGNIEGFNNTSSCVFENPAGLCGLDNMSFSIFHTTILMDFHYSNMSFAGRTPYGTIGMGYMVASMDEIPFTVETENQEFEVQSYFNYANKIFKFSYGYSLLENLHLGISYVIYKNEVYHYMGNGQNLDIGALFDLLGFTFSFSGKNVLNELQGMYQFVSNEDGRSSLDDATRVKYTNTDPNYIGYETLPLQLITAVKRDLWDIELFGQLKWIPSRSMLLRHAALSYHPSFLTKNLWFSVGYKEYPLLRTLSNNITLGVVLNLDVTTIHYAYEASEYIEYTANHYISMSINF